MKKIPLLLVLLPGVTQAHDLDSKVFAFDWNDSNGVETKYFSNHFDCHYWAVKFLNSDLLVKPCYETSMSDVLEKSE